MLSLAPSNVPLKLAGLSPHRPNISIAETVIPKTRLIHRPKQFQSLPNYSNKERFYDKYHLIESAEIRAGPRELRGPGGSYRDVSFLGDSSADPSRDSGQALGMTVGATLVNLQIFRAP
jgi:hypothetical protein